MSDDEIIASVTDEHIRFVLMKLERTATEDRAMADRNAIIFRRLAPTFADMVTDYKIATAPIPPFPNVGEIVTAQCSIWDSWKPYGGRKPNRKKGEKGARSARFKATIEVWTTSEGKLAGSQAFEGTAHLLDGHELTKKVAELRQPTKVKRPFVKLDAYDHEGERFAEYADTLDAVAPQLTGLRMGPLFTVLKGTHFHLDTPVVANEAALIARDPSLKVVVRSPSGDFTFEAFEPTTSSGKPLASNFILQSRISTRSDLRDWTSKGANPT
ncbi:MAG TPA: hypothetical protein VGW40_02820 [Allosphingosinicella sp.]|nr:hypothetical protein [Allosphingosinicella sp.]